MRRLGISLSVMLACHAAFGSPPEALAVAWADNMTLSNDDAKYARYLAQTQWEPKVRLQKVGTVNYWLNSLNRGSTKGRPTLLGSEAQVLRIDLRDYHLDPAVWERMGTFEANEPYFHRPKVWVGDDKKTLKKIADADGCHWLDVAKYTELRNRTYSWAPVVRADWFVWLTGQQVNRGPDGKTFGYYDFLGLGKKQQDFLDLIGADDKKNRQLQTIIAARVGRSGVALNNRGIARQGTVTGGAFWATADFKTSVGKQNVLRLLRDQDTQPPHGDASEQYGTLPNGLFAFFLVNADGTRQDVVPPDIAGDRNGIANDLQVHFRSCAQCHVEGLRPIRDFVRQTFRGPAQLRSLEKGVFQELESLYLNNLDLKMHRDLEIYREALAAVNGLAPEENAARFRAMNEEYFGDEVTFPRAAFELGLTEQALHDALTRQTTDSFVRRALADPLLVGFNAFNATPSVPLRREHFEELIPVLYDVVKGVIP
jgi:hypothetical protein